MDKKNNGSKTVFYVSLVLVAVIAIWSVVFNGSFTVAANAVFTFLTNDFAWLYLICMLVFLVFDIYVAFGKYGKIRLGGDDSRPEYKNLTWFGLLFGCGMGVGLVAEIVIIAVVSVIYIGSAVSGLEKGITFISDTNIYVAIGLLAVCFVLGPKVEILDSFINGLGQYIGNFIGDSLSVSAYGDNSWLGSWKLFYWAWFIAWAPFVGVFVARISKGRTIREFILGVVLVPAFASSVWGSVFGSLGINLAEKGILSVEILKEAVASPEIGLFVVLREYPIGFILCIAAIVSLCAFFVTSANSGVYVLSMLTSDGDKNPPNNKKILWGIIQSIMAVGLLMSGGLKPLQTISLAEAFPFIFIMFMACAAFIKALKKE